MPTVRMKFYVALLAVDISTEVESSSILVGVEKYTHGVVTVMESMIIFHDIPKCAAGYHDNDGELSDTCSRTPTELCPICKGGPVSRRPH